MKKNKPDLFIFTCKNCSYERAVVRRTERNRSSGQRNEKKLNKQRCASEIRETVLESVNGRSVRVYSTRQ